MILTPEITRAENATDQQLPLFDDDIMIRVPVDGFGKTLYFLVDTGFTMSAIDAKYKPLLGETTVTFNAESPLGSNRVLSGFQCPKLFIGGKPLGLKEITCLDLKMARLISGQPCDGILGMDFFEKNVVSIDFDNEIFSLDDAVPEKMKTDSVAVPLERFYQHYLAKVLVNSTNTVDLMIDTGDNSSISFNSDAWQKVFTNKQANKIAATVAGVGNQVTQSKVGAVKQMAIEGLNYTNLHATYIHNPADPSHLGLGFFRRHNVTFDFANQILYLEPSQGFSTPDKEDMSGVHLLRQDGITFVYSVDENSPAFVGGVKPNDVIELVNGQNASSLTLKTIRRALQSHDGDRVELQLRRGNDLLNFEFTLKQTI